MRSKVHGDLKGVSGEINGIENYKRNVTYVVIVSDLVIH